MNCKEVQVSQQQPQDNPELDVRIEEADAVKDLLKIRGFKILQDRYLKVKEQAFRNLIDETIPDSNLAQRQKVYNQICEWIAIPDMIIQAGMDQAAEIKADEQQTPVFIKHPMKYLFGK